MHILKTTIGQFITSFYHFLQLIINQRYFILTLVKREVATQYTGSFLGFLWTFIHPVILIFVFWIVFSIGFKVKPNKDIPFVVWFAAGISAWFLFSDIINRSTSIIVEHSNLIKRTLFHSQILSVVTIVSCSVTHVIFLSVLLVLMLFQKLPFNVCYFQAAYYFFCICVFSLGLGWLVSALNVFIRDTQQIISLILQIGFWGTPIFWDINIMPNNIQKVIKLNPMFYIIQGYRDSFIYFIPFWHRLDESIYFWFIALLTFIIGSVVFKKLKPQFADLL